MSLVSVRCPWVSTTRPRTCPVGGAQGDPCQRWVSPVGFDPCQPTQPYSSDLLFYSHRTLRHGSRWELRIGWFPCDGGAADRSAYEVGKERPKCGSSRRLIVDARRSGRPLRAVRLVPVPMGVDAFGLPSSAQRRGGGAGEVWMISRTVGTSSCRFARSPERA